MQERKLDFGAFLVYYLIFMYFLLPGPRIEVRIFSVADLFCFMLKHLLDLKPKKVDILNQFFGEDLDEDSSHDQELLGMNEE